MAPQPPTPVAEGAGDADLEGIAERTFGQEQDPALAAKYGIDPATAQAEPRGLLFNPDRIQADSDIVSLFDEVAEAFPKEFDEYTRGVQSLDDIEERSLAAMMGTTTEDIRQLRALKAEDFTRGGFTLINMASEIKKVAQRVASPEGSEADGARLRILMEDFVTTTMHVKGLQTETARTLSAMRISKKATAEASAQVSQVLESYGGLGVTKRLAAMLGTMDDPAAVGSFVQRTHRMSAVDMLWEAYYASLLSSPQTHIVNFTSSLAAYNWRVPEMITAYGVGKFRRAVTGGPEGVYAREIMAFLADVESIKFATGQAWTGLTKGQPSDLTTKIEGRVRLPAVTASNVREAALGRWLTQYVPDLLKDGHWTQRGFDLLADYTIRGPSRLMISADEFNKGLAYTSFMRQAATRQAMDEGLGGAALGKRVAELLASPEDLMPEATENALRFAQQITFQDPLGPMGRSLQKTLTLQPGFESPVANFTLSALQAPLRMTFPFVKTPINIFKYVSRRVAPLNFAMPSFWEQIGKGGAEADLAIAQLALGTAMAYGAFELATSGYVSGAGPMDPRLAQQWRSLGWQEYSITFPKDSAAGRALGMTQDHNISIKRFDPFTMVMGLAADMNDIWSYATPDERDLLAATLTASIWRNLGSRTFLQQFGELQKAIGGLEKGNTAAVQTFFSRMAASPVVPAGVAWLGRTLDPEERVRRSARSPTAEAPEPRAFGRHDLADDIFNQVIAFGEETVNRIRSRAPGLGQDLPPLLNFFGEEWIGPTGYLWNLVPFYHQDMAFNGEDLEALGLPRDGWTGVPNSMLPLGGSWEKFLDTVGPEGEFIRLGWAPGRHADRILGTPLTPQQYHDYVKAANSVQGDEPFIFEGELVTDLEGLTLKPALRLVMSTEAYWNAPDHPEVSGSKARMIREVVNHYRHEAGTDPEVGLGGADLVVFLAHPDLAQRVLKTRLQRLSPQQLEELEGLVK